jgi:acetamidase/formamidase
LALIRDVAHPRAALAPGALHQLHARTKTVHWGYFDASLAPALTVASGDLIQAEAITHHAGDAPELMMDEAINEIFRAIPEADRNPGVHIMTGPIFVERQDRRHP